MELLERAFEVALNSPEGIKKLRGLILSLAMQGRLVPQDPNDLPASELLKDIDTEKAQLVKSGFIKQPKPLTPVDPKELPYSLPKAWRWVRMGQVCSYIQRGKGPKYVDHSERQVISQKCVRWWGLDLEPARYIEPESLDAYEQTRFLSGGDLLWNSTGTGTIGRACLFPSALDGKKLVADSHVTIVRPLGVRSSFLWRWIQSPAVQSEIENLASGTTNQIELNTSTVINHLVPLPPLCEQDRIVAKIDELMKRCDELERLQASRTENRTRVNAAAVYQLLNVAEPGEHRKAAAFIGKHFEELYTSKESVSELRKAILQLAVMGKLVPQDPNDPPASELLKQIRAERSHLLEEGEIKVSKPTPPITSEETPFHLPRGWEWIRIADVAQLITSGSRDWAKYYAPSGAIFLTMGNLSRGTYELRLDTIRYVSPPNDSEGARTRLEAGDLLISITGDVGNLGLIPEDFGEAYINQHTCLLRIMPACRNRYFPELLRSPLAKTQFDAPQRGIKNSFRLGDVGEMIVPLPPLPMQRRIVSKVDQLMSLCDSLERQIDDSSKKQFALLSAITAQIGGQPCA